MKIIEVKLATEQTANTIRNLYPLYLYDLSEIYGNKPNEYGIYEEEDIKTLSEQYHNQDIWFQNPQFLFPYIIYVDHKPAGFILLSTGKYSPKDTDYYVYEFFLLRPYRGNNIAQTAAIKVFDKYHGKWILYTNPPVLSKRAPTFWRKTIHQYTNGCFEEEIGETVFGEKLIFKFKN